MNETLQNGLLSLRDVLGRSEYSKGHEGAVIASGGPTEAGERIVVYVRKSLYYEAASDLEDELRQTFHTATGLPPNQYLHFERVGDGQDQLTKSLMTLYMLADMGIHTGPFADNNDYIRGFMAAQNIIRAEMENSKAPEIRDAVRRVLGNETYHAQLSTV